VAVSVVANEGRLLTGGERRRQVFGFSVSLRRTAAVLKVVEPAPAYTEVVRVGGRDDGAGVGLVFREPHGLDGIAQRFPHDALILLLVELEELDLAAYPDQRVHDHHHRDPDDQGGGELEGEPHGPLTLPDSVPWTSIAPTDAMVAFTDSAREV